MAGLEGPFSHEATKARLAARRTAPFRPPHTAEFCGPTERRKLGDPFEIIAACGFVHVKFPGITSETL